MFTKLLKSPLALIALIAIAIALVFFQVKNKIPVSRSEAALPASPVEYVPLKSIPFRARATAYGHVEPSVSLTGKSEVSGKVVYVHPELQKGGSIKAGSVVLRVEPTAFELTLNQSQAGLEASQSSLKQLEIEEQSTRRLLDIARQNLNVGEAELDRVKRIFERKLVAKSAVDAEEQKVLALRQQLQDVEGKMAAFASRKAEMEAQINQSQSQVDQSKDTLGRTEIILPFDARIGEVSVEEGEFVSTGNTLFEAHGLGSVEINAELPINRFRPIIQGFSFEQGRFNGAESINRGISQLRLQSTVRLVGDPAKAQWPGRLSRISESVDPTRDTIGLLVTVDKPYEGVVPGVRPPLLKGMYTSVEFIAPERSLMVLPRKALHQGRVYTVDENDRLDIKPVNIAFTQGELAVLAEQQEAVRAGDRIIVSDVIPLIPGLDLNPVESTSVVQSLAREALSVNVMDAEQ